MKIFYNIKLKKYRNAQCMGLMMAAVYVTKAHP